MNQELQIKARLLAIERKWDKNLHPFYKITLPGCSNYFYAFSNNLPQETLTALQETPPKLVNQLALVSYQELPNKNTKGTFFRVKDLQLC